MTSGVKKKPDELAREVNEACRAHYEQLEALRIKTGPKGAHVDYPRMLDIEDYLV